MQFNLRFHCD